jgi:superfamily II DNA helicase RecQ
MLRIVKWVLLCRLASNCHTHQQLGLFLIPTIGRQLFSIVAFIDVLRGSKVQRILNNKHDELTVYGIGYLVCAGFKPAMIDLRNG